MPHSHIVWISFDLETSSLEPFSIFYDLIASCYTKGKLEWRQSYLFVLNHIILIRKCFFTSAYFSPFDLKSILNQKLFKCSNVIRLKLLIGKEWNKNINWGQG